MKPRNREINIFNLSMLDVISGALGAFLIIMVVLFPYYKKDFIKENQRLRAGVKKLGGQIRVAHDSVEACRNTNEKLIGYISGIEEKYSDCQNQLNGIGGNIDDLEEELRQCKKDKDALQDSINKLQTQPEGTLFGIPKKAGHVVYVVDISGSMNEPIQSAALDQTIDELLLGIEADFFNIIYFSSQATVWERGWLPGTVANRTYGANYCKTRPKQGGTNTYEALRTALAMSRAEMVYLITDGQPTAGPKTAPADIIAQVGIWNSGKKTQIFSVMVGVPPKEAETRELYSFLKKLALNNRGKYIGR